MMSALTMVLLAAGLVVAALLIGTAFSRAATTKWWKRWSGTGDRRGLLEPAVADALEAKADLERGVSRTAEILSAPSSSHGHSDGGGSGGGDGGGAD